jgi:putative nucleotidyltransferase with HDIG domain
MAAAPGGWRYRVGQALAATRAGLAPGDMPAVQAELPPPLFALFAAMAPRDQVHAVRVLRRLEGAEPLLRQAALLHDAGKAVAPLGTPGRSLVVLAEASGTVAVLERVPLLGRRVRRYRAHPEIGADMLRQAGADAVLVEIVAEHQALSPRLPETLRLQAVDGRE